VLRRAGAGLPDEADRVGVIDHDQRVVGLGEVADAGQRSEVAVHREHAVGRDDPAPSARCGLELYGEVVEVAVPVAVTRRLRQPYAVDDARVVELVGDDRVGVVGDRLEEAAVGVEARRVQDGRLRAEERGQATLELGVELGGAADEPYGGHPEAPLVEARVRCGDNRWVVGEPEVVVGAEVDDALTRDGDLTRLR
jgi:hypothetical protein